MEKGINYTVRRQGVGYNPIDKEATIISRHHVFGFAKESLERQRSGAKKYGGYSQDFIWDEFNECRID